MVFGKITNLAVVIAAVAVLALGVSSCGDGNNSREAGDGTTVPDPAEEIMVGAVAPLTGSLSPTGRGMKNGFELAVKEINASSLLGGRTIRLLVEDNLSNLDGNRAAYGRLVERGVPVILGPFTSSATDNVVVPLSIREEFVAVGPTSAANGLSAKSAWLFRTTLSVNRLVPEGVRCIAGLRDYDKAAAIVNDADTFSRSSHDEMKKAFGENDIMLVSEQKFRRTGNEELPDLTGQLNAVRDAAPQALFVSALPPGRIGVMVQARRLGIDDVPFVHTLLTIDEAGRADDQLSGSAEGAVSFSSWSTGIDTPGNMEFMEAYREEYGEAANAFAARSYASVYILARAIADAPSADSEAIREALAGIRNLDTVLGGFSFDENGDAVYDPVVEVVEDGAFRVLTCPDPS